MRVKCCLFVALQTGQFVTEPRRSGNNKLSSGCSGIVLHSDRVRLLPDTLCRAKCNANYGWPMLNFAWPHITVEMLLEQVRRGGSSKLHAIISLCSSLLRKRHFTHMAS